MGQALGTGDGKQSVNVDLNIVPFIDLMSCLTAFLLVAAVWVNLAQVKMHAGGRARDGQDVVDPEPELSVLIEKDDIWVGVSRVDQFTRIPRDGSEWGKLEDSLREQKKSVYFDGKHAIQVAAMSTNAEPVAYATLITTMDIAAKVGFDDVAVTDPNGLAALPHL